MLVFFMHMASRICRRFLLLFLQIILVFSVKIFLISGEVDFSGCFLIKGYFMELVSERWYVRRRDSVVVVWPMQLLVFSLFSERHSRNGQMNLYTTFVWLRGFLGEFVLFLMRRFDVLNLVQQIISFIFCCWSTGLMCLCMMLVITFHLICSFCAFGFCSID